MSLETLEISNEVVERLRDELPAVARATAEAVIQEVPGYRDLRVLSGETLDRAVELALRVFLNVASASGSSAAATAVPADGDVAGPADSDSPLQPALDVAYRLGRGEARSGRTMDVLLAAYRVGARVAWRKWSLVAINAGVSGDLLSRFAELNFAYIDELSAASVSGYSDQLETIDRTRQRDLDRFTRALLAGGSRESLQSEADRIGWQPPGKLCVVVLPASFARGIGTIVDPRSLQLSEDLPGVEASEDLRILIVPLISRSDRDRLKTALSGREAVVGPWCVWDQASLSYRRALRVRHLAGDDSREAADADDFLVDLIVGADPDALTDLREKVLAPLEELRPSTAAKLIETLKAWLLHQGRREAIAAALFIHPQTVRYRMGQLRDLYGDQLENPEFVLKATVALGAAKASGRSAGSGSR